MGGKVTHVLTDEVTHLVVGEVGSGKYFCFANEGMPIMTRGWLVHIWNLGKKK